MSDAIKHECGIALVRLLKPLPYYYEKYGSALYGLQKLYLLMEKQHNRGQDGVGVATIKLDMPSGEQYIDRFRSVENQPIKHAFSMIFDQISTAQNTYENCLNDVDWLKKNIAGYGEVMMGHLRYGTHGKNQIQYCHPHLRSNNWMTRNLLMAGNFNLTNVDELLKQLVDLGQHPREKSDTVTVLEKVGHFVDVEVQRVFEKYKRKKYSQREITDFIIKELDLKKALSRAAKDFDGGYAMLGLLGHGDAFVLRDPRGIRPAYYYYDDEVAVVASERACIQTAFDLPESKISELEPGQAFIVKKDASLQLHQVVKPAKKKACSFERIYFSRGNDADIYKERKALGSLLVPQILKEIKYDLKQTVFSYIPNTAETAFYGMLEGVEDFLSNERKKKINDPEALKSLLDTRVRSEKIAVKDVKLRTFITEDSARDDLVSHVYDITYNSIVPREDTLVVIDDSIVRGTTLEKSILSSFDRLQPKKIIIVSSAPQIRYPDCYGIDMSRMQEFVAFRAVISLLDKQNKNHLLQEVYALCKEELTKPANKMTNQVKKLYGEYTEKEISKEIAVIVRPKHIFSDVRVIYQSVNNLHTACPNHKGDWYFTGNYPTPGGNRVVNQSFINYIDGNNERAY